MALLLPNMNVRGKLEGLSPEQILSLKGSFVKNDHQRFRKEFAALRHVPYGTTKAYQEGIESADMDRVAKLVKIAGVLLQTV